MKRNFETYLKIAAALLLCAPGAEGQEVSGAYNWSSLARQGLLTASAMVVSLDGREAVKIENTNDAPWQVNLLTIANPAIIAQRYALTGTIRYEGVQGDGYLEMWNCFAPEKPGLTETKYFSRTLGGNGPMGKISGTSGWRDFELPFDRTGAANPPKRLEVNLVLPGRGTVYVGPIKLAELPAGKSGAASFHANGWWSDRAGAVVGASGGVIFGGLGGLIGLLASLGKGRRFTVVMLGLMTFVGFGALIGGVLAVVQRQPYAVWYPLTLGGIILGSVSPAMLWVFSRRNQEVELRRMQALDV